MRPGTKLAVMLAGGALVWGLIAMALCWREKPQKKAVRVAQTALYASVDNPESVKVVAVSEPDSVFGRCYIDDDEKMAIAVSMMKVNEKVMSQTDGLRDLDFEDSSVTDLVSRQMSPDSWTRTLHASLSAAGKSRSSMRPYRKAARLTALNTGSYSTATPNVW